MTQGAAPPKEPELALGTEIGSTATQRVSGSRNKSLSYRLRDYGGSFLFVVPYLVFFFAFLLGPLLFAAYMSVHNWQTIGGNQGFIGLQHYQRILTDTNSIEYQDFLRGMKNTGLFVIISVPLLVIVPFFLALLLANGPFRSFFRGIFYLPAVLSVTVAMTIWLWIFQPQGLLNGYLHTNTQWLINTPTAWFAIIISTLWWTIGFNMVVLLAGVIDVPQDYHEAAKIDGANAVQRVWYITVPVLRPILAFITITQTLASFGLFGQPFILTQGGPQRTTEPIMYTIYLEAFGGNQDIGAASAMSFILGAVLVVIALILLRVFRLKEA